jgi:hypothetical protein
MMAVRRLPPDPPDPPVELLDPDDLTPTELEAKQFVSSSVLLGVAHYEIIAVLKGDPYKLDAKKARAFIEKTRVELSARVIEITRTSRPDQILRLRGVLRDWHVALATPGVPPDRRPKNTDIVRLEDLIARVEGNLAPTRNVVAFGSLTKDKLELLGVQSPEEIAEFMAAGES